MNSSDPFNFPEQVDPPPPPQQPALEEPIRVVIHKPWPTWDFGDLLVFVGILFVFFFLAVPLALAVAHFVPRYAHQSLHELGNNLMVELVAQVAAYLLWLGAVWLIVVAKSREPFFATLRWHWPRARRLGILLAIGIGVAFFDTFLSNWLPAPKHLPMEDYFQTTAAAYTTAVFGILFAPFFEELFFRGLLYPVLRARLSLIFAVLLTAIPFAALHGFQLAFSWGPLVVILFIGIVLTLVREFTQSLAASWMVHATYNATLFAMTFLATGGFKHLEQMH